MNNTVNVQQLDICQTLYTPNRNYISLKDTNLVKKASGFGISHTQLWAPALPHTKDVIWAGHLTLNLFFHCKKSVDNHSYFAGLLWGLKERNIESILYGRYFKIISHLLPHYPQIIQKHWYCTMPKKKNKYIQNTKKLYGLLSQDPTR